MNVVDFTKERNRMDRVSLEESLMRSEKGSVLGVVANLMLIIGNDPVLSNMCGYDEFQNSHVLHHAPPTSMDGAPPQPGPYPRPWTAADVSLVLSYLQRAWTSQAKRTDTEEAMVAVSAQRRFHPIRDWLDALKWDGENRLNVWLSKVFGAVETEYTQDVGTCTLLAAVKRVRKPGCKFDHMPVLEGGQGIGKSTAVKALFGEKYFTDSLPSALESKDAALGLQGAWCVEFAEIEQLIRTEEQIAKAFLSRSTDRFRAPYGRQYISYPRQCIFIGTTNDTDYLRDVTGNRRYWPVKCHFVEIEWLQKNREQLWAEAAFREAAGEAYWLRDEIALEQAKEAQEQRQEEDVWDDKVRAFLLGRRETTTAEVLTDALMFSVDRQTKREQMRVAKIIKKQGWERDTVRVGTITRKIWREGGHK